MPPPCTSRARTPITGTLCFPGAAELASAAGVKRLVLVHLSPAVNDLEAQRLAANKIFGGDVFVGRDLDRYTF